MIINNFLYTIFTDYPYDIIYTIKLIVIVSENKQKILRVRNK